MKTLITKLVVSTLFLVFNYVLFASPIINNTPIPPEVCENGALTSGGADVVILVDSSGSMRNTWAAIVDASDSLEDAIKDKCGAEARITLLTLDKVDPGSNTNAPTGFISHEKYIINNSSYTGPFETNDGSGLDSEQGSKGIADVSNHFPWREGACRSILYISDEWLDSVSKGEAPSKASIPIGVNAANSNNVTVFTHLIGQGSGKNPILADHYKELAESTGGTSHIGDLPSKELYINLVSDAACKCTGGCETPPPPESCESELLTSGGADVVILVDSSGSMSSTWAAILDASDSLEDAIKDKCGADANITLLAIDRVDPGSGVGAPTGFISHEQYIIDNAGYSGPFATNDGGGAYEGEQGSKAIADVSNYFPWKEGSCRSILYISDEWLDSINKGEASSKSSIPIGVNAANSNNVTVFTHLIGQGNGKNPILADHYKELAESTGGTSHIGDEPSKELYIDLVSDAACKCGGACETPKSCLVIEPKLECVKGKGWQVSFTNSTSGFNPTDLDITSLTTGVTVVGNSPSWTLSGATPNSTVKLSANGVMKNGGSEKGTDLCCSSEVEVEIPDEECKVIIGNPEEACMLAETSPAGPFFDAGNNQWAFPLRLTTLNGNTINEVKVTPVTAGVTMTNGPIYPVGTPSLSFTGVTVGQMAEFKFCAYDKNKMNDNETFDCCKMNVQIKIRVDNNPPKDHQPLEVVK